MKDLYYTIYFLTIGPWKVLRQKLTGTYRKGAGIGAGVGSAVETVLSYALIAIHVLIAIIIVMAIFH